MLNFKNPLHPFSDNFSERENYFWSHMQILKFTIYVQDKEFKSRQTAGCSQKKLICVASLGSP